jgi:hypothetical protein
MRYDFSIEEMKDPEEFFCPPRGCYDCNIPADRCPQPDLHECALCGELIGDGISHESGRWVCDECASMPEFAD